MTLVHIPISCVLAPILVISSHAKPKYPMRSLSHLPAYSKIVSFLQISSSKFCIHFSYTPQILHAPSISSPFECHVRSIQILKFFITQSRQYPLSYRLLRLNIIVYSNSQLLQLSKFLLRDYGSLRETR
jgi:hypothetical protein